MSTNPFDAPSAYAHRDLETAAPMEITDILFSFEGRIPRRVYWGYLFGSAFAFFLAIMVLAILFGPDSDATNILTILLYLPLIWTSLAIQVKRWHDRDYSGWMVLIGFIPIVGSIWSFVELGCLRGTEGSNSYGQDPT